MTQTIEKFYERISSYKPENIYKLTIYKDGSFPFIMEFSENKHEEKTVKLFFDERTLMAFIEKARTIINKSPFHFLSPLDFIQGVEIMGIRFGWGFLNNITDLYSYEEIKSIDVSLDLFEKMAELLEIELPEDIHNPYNSIW